MEENKLKSIAHIRETDDQIQSVEEHLLGVKSLSESYGEKIGVKHIAGLAGMLHDMGKYTNQFTDYILKAVYEPEHAPARGTVDHSSAGGRMLYDLYHKGNDKSVFQKTLAEIVGNAIISHHSYLHDFLSPELTSPYLRRVKDKELSEYPVSKKIFFKNVINKHDFEEYVNKAIKELIEFIKKTRHDNREAHLMFLSKYIFSTLIDADRTNTRQFVNKEHTEPPFETEKLFNNYYQKLMKRLEMYKKKGDAANHINVLRSEMSEKCEQFAERESGIYTLSIPTGGGKTLASLRYALKHAEIHGKKRIIYIIPYTTIIEQNAAEVRDILGEDSYVLEHHSNTIDDASTDEDIYMSDAKRKTMLAKDNWDAPVIFTTMVQYLNVFFAHGSRNVRRLHNLTESILIFDEVQKVPTHCISLFNQSLNFLNKFGKSSIVLCTATQPALDFVNQKLEIENDAEMIDDIDHVVEQFKRVNIVDEATEKQFKENDLVQFIDEKLKSSESILTILNTKQVVRDLYEVLKDRYDDTPVYHLSTAMCPSHRTVILDEIRERLKNNQPVICISTQLIEAGVDISFECVIRSLAGLDSIAQAAGRCNRHGQVALRNVYVIDYAEENLKFLKEIDKGKNIARKILTDLKNDSKAHGGDVLSVKAIEYYFKHFYKDSESDLDYPIKQMNQTMVELLMANYEENTLLHEYRIKNSHKQDGNPDLIINNSYQTAAKNFSVIDSPTTSVIVPYGEGEGEGKDIIATLNGDVTIEDLSKILQKAQRYSISVYPYQLDLLQNSGSLTTLFDNQVYALVDGAYDNEYGLNIEGDSRQQFYSF